MVFNYQAPSLHTGSRSSSGVTSFGSRKKNKKPKKLIRVERKSRPRLEKNPPQKSTQRAQEKGRKEFVCPPRQSTNECTLTFPYLIGTDRIEDFTLHCCFICLSLKYEIQSYDCNDVVTP